VVHRIQNELVELIEGLASRSSDGIPTVQHRALYPDDRTPGHGMTISAHAADHRVAAPELNDFGTPAEPPIGGTP
jgi:hypothetical protein